MITAEYARTVTRNSENLNLWGKLRESWKYGLINRKIEKAAKKGKSSITIDIDSSFEKRIKERIIKTYKELGYSAILKKYHYMDVNYNIIEGLLIEINWNRKEENNV